MKEKAIKKWKISAPEPKEHWASTYFKKNPFRCVTAGLTGFGLIVIFAYHFHIEYAPSFDINSLASTVFLAAFVGLCFLAICSVCVFSPVYFIGVYAFENKQADAEVDHRLAIAFILSGMAFLAFFSMIFIATEFDVAAERALLLPVAFVLAYLLSKKAFSKVHVIFHNQCSQNKPGRWQGWAFSTLLALSKTTSEWYRENTEAAKLAAFMLLIFMLQVTPVQIYFIVMRDAPGLDEKIDWVALYQQLLMISLTLQVAGFYLVKAWHRSQLKQRHKLYSVIAVLSAPFLITFWGRNPAFFPCSVAYMLKIGNFATAEMTLTSTGCDIVASKGAPACTQNKIYGAYVMSRIGTEMHLKIRSLDGKSPITIYLPAKEVSGVKVDESKHFYNKQSVIKFLSTDRPA